MKAKTKSCIFLFLIFFLFFSCSKEENNSLYLNLDENEFVVQPQSPSILDEISIILNDCSYNQLAYIKKEGFDIQVVKHFNSMMKQPCVLKLDTISLGKLEAGTYQLELILVDKSTMIAPADTISYSSKLQIVVSN